MVDLDSQLPTDHRARLVWAFVQTLDLSPFHARIKVRDDLPGRPASDPAVLLAIWLYATLEAIGSARAIERLCREHAAFRWLAGGVPVNHDMLSEFRRDSTELLDKLMTQSLTALIAEGLISLEEMAIDGTKVRARAGGGSMAGRERLAGIEAEVGKHVAKLKEELDQDASAAERRRVARGLKAAEEREARVARAKQRLEELRAERAERAARDKRAGKTEPKVSVADPEVRSMRMADGAVHPAWNVQVATCSGFVVTIDPTDRRNDTGLAPGLVEQIVRRCGKTPERLLADAKAITLDDIVTLGERHPDLEVFSPPARQRGITTPGGERNRRSQMAHEAGAVKAWRERMETDEGKAVYQRRKLPEHAHAKMKNRGFARMPVHGMQPVRSVCYLHAIAHNMSHAHTRRSKAG